MKTGRKGGGGCIYFGNKKSKWLQRPQSLQYWSSLLFLHYWSWFISDFSLYFPLLLHLASYISLPVLQGPAREELPNQKNQTLKTGSASKLMKYTGREWFHPIFNVVPPKCFITDVLGVTTDMEVLSRLNFSWYTLFGTSAASVSNDHIEMNICSCSCGSCCCSTLLGAGQGGRHPTDLCPSH